MKNKKILKNAYKTLSLALVIFIMTISIAGLVLLIVNKIRRDDDFDPYQSKSFLISVIVISSELVSIIIYSFFTRQSAKIATELNKGFNEIANGNFNYKIEGKYDKIFQDLIDNFNLTTKQLENIETLRRDFATNFSHEFKTPIVSILGFAKLLQNPYLSEEEKKEYVDIIIEESTRLANLSSNTLLISKIENQNIITDKIHFSLDEQIRKSVVILEHLWEEKNIEIDLDLDENIDFYGNEELMKEVWINIIHNSIKYSPNNSIIKIQAKNNPNHLTISISDNGIGMDDDTLTHIFDKYFQSDRSSGNGLGLSIVKKIITLHNGTITATSQKDKGSTFNIEFDK